MIKIASQNGEPAVIGGGPVFRQAKLVDRVEKTRQEYRRFSLVRAGVWGILALLVVGGLLALADYLWIIRLPIRQLNWVLAGAIVAALGVRRIILNRRAARNRCDTALEIETAFPDLGQRVCTTLEYAEPTPNTMPAWPSLIQALTTETEERTYRLDFKQVVPWRSLRWPSVAAACLIIFFLTLIIVLSSARIAAMRLFLLPFHYTQLQVEPGDLSVKFGGDVAIRAIISGRPVSKAELFSRKAGSGDPWSTVSLGQDDRTDAALVGTLETSIKKCREALDYRVTAGEVESETYRLSILHPLVLKKITATIEPPAYTRKKPNTVEEGDLQVIEGSSARLRFELDRPAQTGLLQLAPVKGAKSAESMPPVSLKIQGKAMMGIIMNVTQDLVYTVQAEAADGTKLDPRQFHVSVQPDRKPTIHILKPEPVIEALPTTEVTMQLSSKDDFGLAKAGIVYKISNGPWETLLVDQNSEQPVSLTNLAKLYLEERKLNFQDGIVYYAFAEDNYPSGPHRVTSEMQFIDIRAFKREFAVGKAGEPGKSISLELLISRQRTNLQHTFGQCGESQPDARIARRLAKSERSLAKLTAEFSEIIAKMFGRIPCLDQAVEVMQSASAELDKKDMKQACRQEEQALTLLIQARENLRNLLVNPKTGGEAEKLDYKAHKNMPEKPKEDEEEETPEENLQKQIADLAQEEREIAEEIDGKSGGESSNSQSPKDSSKQSESKSKSQGGGQSKESGESKENGESKESEQSKENGESKEGGQSPGKSNELAERQQQAAQKAADIAQKMQADEAITELAEERMDSAERAIRSSAKSLEQGKRGEASQEAKDAATQLERLARQVAALKSAELAAKLQASENIARQIAQRQRDAEKNENNSSEKSEGKGKGKDKGQGEGQGEGEEGEGGDSPGFSRLAEQQRAEAEEARTLEDLVSELQKDASLSDGDLVRVLEEAAEANPPKEIVAQMEKAAQELKAGDRENAQREISQSVRRLDALADQLETARHGFEQPKLEALMAIEKQAAELQKELNAPVADRHRGDLEKKMVDLHGAMTSLSGTDSSLREDTKELAVAIEGGDSGQRTWRQVRQGYYTPPERYPSAIQRVDHALQVRIQEIILKDAILDQDQPVPEQYRKLVEKYYQTLSEDLRP